MDALSIHPIMAISQAGRCFKLANAPLSKTTNPKESTALFEKLDNLAKNFSLYTNGVLKEYNGTDKEEITALQKEVERGILFSAISPDFYTKYADEIDAAKDYENLKKLLTEIIGTQSQAAQKVEAERIFHSAVRDIEAEEKFTRYLKRLERLSKKVSGEPKVQEYLVSQKFTKGLSPENKTFLVDQDQDEGTLLEKANFLDKRQKYKPVADTNALGTTAGRFHELQLQNEKLKEELISFKSEMKQLIIGMRDVDVNQTKVEKESNVQKQTRAQPRQPQRHPHCQRCGLRNHRADTCRGHSFTCHICNRKGHLSNVCPARRSNTNTSKNF